MATMQEIKASIVQLKADITAEKVEVQAKLAELAAQVAALKDQIANGGTVAQADLDELAQQVEVVTTGVKDISEPTVTP